MVVLNFGVGRNESAVVVYEEKTSVHFGGAVAPNYTAEICSRRA